MSSPIDSPLVAAIARILDAPAQKLVRRVAIGYSGGLDSGVLLHAAEQMLRQRGIAPRACHVHHGLSPHADAWVAHCKSTCAAMEVPCDIVRVTIARDDPAGPEAAARRARFQVFNELNADRVLVAHHADDQAETVMLNLLRGTGVLGLAGIPQAGDRYLRPLLSLERTQLLAYAEQHGLRWIEDESNADVRLTRNYLRHTLFPGLKERFPGAIAALGRSASHAAEAQTLLEELARIDDPTGELSVFPVPLAALRDLPPQRLHNLLRCKLKACGLQAPSTDRLKEFARQLCSAGPDRHPELVAGWTLRAAQRQLHLIRPP